MLSPLGRPLLKSLGALNLGYKQTARPKQKEDRGVTVFSVIAFALEIHQ